jgi:hypothetical protein
MQKKQTQADVGDDLCHYFHILAPTICNNKKASKLKFLLQQKFGFLAKISCQQVILVWDLKKILGFIEIP